MKQDHLWEIFQKTGKVEDYLRYCGITSVASGNNALVDNIGTGETRHEANHRRTDCAGKQQNR